MIDRNTQVVIAFASILLRLLTLPYGMFVLVLPMHFGALLARRFPRFGFGLLFIGATLVSVIFVPLGVEAIRELLNSGGSWNDPVARGSTVAIALLILCDVLLGFAAIELRRRRNRSSMNTLTRDIPETGKEQTKARSFWWVGVGVWVGMAVVLYFGIGRQSRRTYQVRLDTAEPNQVTISFNGRNDTVCSDTFHSKELHDRLAAKDGRTVIAQYDTLSDFGKVRGHNVHSVDGIVLANGSRLLRDDYATQSGVGGGKTTVDADGKTTITTNGNDCWR